MRHHLIVLLVIVSCFLSQIKCSNFNEEKVWKEWLKDTVIDEDIWVDKITQILIKNKVLIRELADMRLENLVSMGIPMGDAVRMFKKINQNSLGKRKEIVKRQNYVVKKNTKRFNSQAFDWTSWLNYIEPTQVSYVIAEMVGHGIRTPSDLDILNVTQLTVMGIKPYIATMIVTKRQLERWLTGVVHPSNLDLVVRTCVQHMVTVPILTSLDMDELVGNVGISLGDAIHIREKVRKGRWNRHATSATSSRKSITMSGKDESFDADSAADLELQSIMLSDSDSGQTVSIHIDHGTNATVPVISNITTTTPPVAPQKILPTVIRVPIKIPYFRYAKSSNKPIIKISNVTPR